MIFWGVLSMARLTKPILGEVKGKIGSLVVRTINGKQFVSLRPEHYRKSKSANAIYEKNKFSVVTKLAKTLNAIPEIKDVWLNSNSPGTSAYHKILKANLTLPDPKTGLLNFTFFPYAKRIYPIKVTLNTSNINVTVENKFLDVMKKNLNGTLYILQIWKEPAKSNWNIKLTLALPITLDSFKQNVLTVDVSQLRASIKVKQFNVAYFIAMFSAPTTKEKYSFTNTASVPLI